MASESWPAHAEKAGSLTETRPLHDSGVGFSQSQLIRR